MRNTRIKKVIAASVTILAALCGLAETKPRLIGGHQSVSWLIYAVSPDALCTWNDPRAGRSKDMEELFVRKETRSLPEVGSHKHGSMNTEGLLIMHPTAIIIADFTRRKVMSDSLMKNANVEVAHIEFDKFDQYPSSIRTIGRLAKAPERAEKLAKFVEHLNSELNARVGSIPKEKRVRVYYAASPNGLETAAGNTVHDHIISYAGGINVFPPKSALNRPRFKISFEQLVEYEPDVIIVYDREFAVGIKEKAGWKNLRAVKNGKIYLVPSAPVSWIDRPVSMFQLMGAWWLATKLYPEKFPEGYRPMAEKYFQAFLQVKLDKERWEAMNTDNGVN